MSQLIQTQEDKKEHEKKFGVYHDNVNLSIKKEGFDMVLAVGIFKREDTYIAYAGQNPEEAMRAEGANYTEAINNLIEIL